MNWINKFSRPSFDEVPAMYCDRLEELFNKWNNVIARNRELSLYYNMKNRLKNVGIDIPDSFKNTNCVVGWCSKAVHAHANRSTFDGFVFGGRTDEKLNALVRRNRMRSLYRQACIGSLVHGISAITVMRGKAGQPPVMVRAFSATQFSVLWDKDANRIGCGVVLSDVDHKGQAIKYIAHFPEAVLTLTKVGEGKSERWECEEEPNPMGRPLMEIFVNDPDLDRPLGHSMLTPELLGIVDKAVRDVLRMEIGAVFFTFPQRFALGVAEDLFAAPIDENTPVDEDGDPIDEHGNKIARVSSAAAKFQAYIGAIWAFTRDENGEVPQVGQFTPTSAENFTIMFENDAQRFSGATNVPLGQLGVLSNTYTSSDALGAANDPLILEVEAMNWRNAEVLEEVARMMMAINEKTTIEELEPEQQTVQAYMQDPSAPTLAARADAWTKLAGTDQSLPGTRVFYEGVGLPQPTIDRIFAEKKRSSVIDELNALAASYEVPRLPGDSND